MDMQPTAPSPAPVPKVTRWVGYVLSVLPCLMLFFSGGMKLAHPPDLDQGFEHLGIPVSHALGLGIVEIISTVVYLVPRTAVLGAILLTGYLGGAIQAHVRLGEPFVVQFLLGVALWGGLFLRDTRLRALLPIVSKE
jgi:hypothetical protein